ncbi:uncharacterized protein LOC125232466 isoform X1 [Leguminivora glycinivorella]|uniref:uncharacterized protein LOC125232466 isoform X1 n=1 Tax=Leguminivora glycinivorella TaxID=1035111 RepID=UPI00200FE1AF|nr:uncharacterized protein LOC125232466 isoform X1 [Leguminivora glycinivorella]
MSVQYVRCRDVAPSAHLLCNTSSYQTSVLCLDADLSPIVQPVSHSRLLRHPWRKVIIQMRRDLGLVCIPASYTKEENCNYRSEVLRSCGKQARCTRQDILSLCALTAVIEDETGRFLPSGV